MGPNIKICGLHPEDDFSFTVHARVTHAGFVFVPKSKRFVSPQQARVAVQSLQETCQVMAVVAGMDLIEIRDSLSLSGITGVQLHGEEPPTWCDDLCNRGYTVWKAVRVPTPDLLDVSKTIAHVMREISVYLRHVDGILLDASPPVNAAHGVTGGYGKTFMWDILPTIGTWLQQDSDRPFLWVAGGLHSGNVTELLSVWQPDGLDVSSGVEENGRKSVTKIMDLIEAVEKHAGHSNLS